MINPNPTPVPHEPGVSTDNTTDLGSTLGSSYADEEWSEFISRDHWFYGAPPLSYYKELAPFVYYIQCGMFLKIGTSIEPEKRVDQLRRGGKAKRPSIWVGDPQLIAYHQGSAHLERELHHEFAHLRDQGEWFRLDEELIEHVADAQQRQVFQEVELHDRFHKQRIASGKWPSVAVDLPAEYRKQMARKAALDLEWMDAA